MQDKQITQLPGSLVTDSSFLNQPEGTHRFALNALSETTSGDQGFISNEPGSLQCINLNGYNVIGSINLTNGESVLFLTNGSNSKISLQKNCTLTNIVDAECLNFNDLYPVTGVAKIRKGCNRVIYFRDSYNNDRSIDIDEILNNPLENRYYDGSWKCELFKLAPDFDFPCLDYVRTNNSGGSLKLGSYQFGIALGDEDLNFTNVLSVLPTIPIINGTLSSPNSVEGGDPTQENATTKSIDLQVTNIDTDFQYIKFYVVESIGGVITAYEADTLAISGTTLNYTYKGLNYNSATVVPLEDINVPTIVYNKSKSMEQHDNRLLRANLQERSIDHSAFQRAANLIQTRYITKPVKYTSNSSVFSGDYYVDNRSYMRDEIYALAISAVFNDGTETAKYHIPGREIDVKSNGSNLPTNSDPWAQNGTKQHNRKDPINGWDSTEYTVVASTTYPEIVGNLQEWDRLLQGGGYITLNPNEIGQEDAAPINRNPDDTVKRWEVYNTAYRDEQFTITDTYYSKGQMAYWESEYSYPNTTDCSFNRIFPTGKIRHHKMPDTTFEPHFISTSGLTDGSDIYTLSLGVEFDLTAFKTLLQSELGSEYAEIAGFKIARAKRDKGNKSVIDKGIGYRTIEMLYRTVDTGNNDYYLFQSTLFNKQAEIDRNLGGQLRYKSFDATFNNGSTSTMPDENVFESRRDEYGNLRHSYQYMDINAPVSKFNKEAVFQYIKAEKELFGKYEYWGFGDSWITGENSRASFRSVYNSYHTSGYYGTPNPFFTNRIRYDSSVIPANENVTFDGQKVLNRTRQETLLAKIGNYPDISQDGISYGGSPIELDGSSSNSQLNVSVPPYTGTTINDYYTNAYYVSLKNYNPQQYGQLHSLTYYDINTCLISPNATIEVLFGGDIFISEFSFRRTATDDDFVDSYGDERTWWSALTTFYVESEINCKLRHEGYDGSAAQWYYPYRGTTIPNIEDVIFINDETLIADNSISTIIDNYVDGNYCFNQYNYNQDYTREQELQPKFPIYLGFDYCSSCLNEYPTRIVFSEKSYQEEIFDNYRKFLANNYRDLQANTGEIQNVFKESDNLYIRTLHSLWFVPSKYQNLGTTGGTINISTGELFSIPPKEIYSTKYGYNGGQTILDLVATEYGVFYADSSSGIVFQLGGEQQQVEISKVGNRIWFTENLPFKLLEDFPTFPFIDSPTSKLGIGLLGYFDPKFRRYILTKKDYKPSKDLSLYDYQFSEAGNPQWQVYWNNGDNGEIVTDPYNSEFFENKSWTISYSLENKKWVSWHSYLPNFAWTDLSTFYTTLQDNDYTWKHNYGDYTTYYGTKYPHIIEYVNNKAPQDTKICNYINYISQVSQYDSVHNFWRNVKNSTFDRGLFYNDSQSTGFLDVSVKNNSDPFASVLGTFDPSNIFAEQTENNWSINNIRDMVDQTTPEEPIFTTEWSQIQSQYYIDKVPNMNIINYLTKSQYEMEPLRDNYMAARLSYKPLENYRITTKYIATNFNDSPR